MFPILAQLGLALLGAHLQNKQARQQYDNAMANNLDSTLNDIRAMRASRAGDSGYMQRAMGGTSSYPQYPDSGSGQMLAQLGAALLSRKPDIETDPEYGSQASVKLRRSEF